jgi:hypothetical protein
MYLLRRIAIFLPILFLLSCASLPSGVHRFSVLAGEPAQSSWKLEPLDTDADIRLVIDMPGGETPADIAAVQIEFGKYNKFRPQAALFVSDPRCSGFYGVVFNYQSDWSQDESMPLKLSIPWGRQLIVEVRWRGSDHIVVTVNNNEPVDVPLLGSVDTLKVTAHQGSIKNAVLDYRVVEN